MWLIAFQRYQGLFNSPCILTGGGGGVGEEGEYNTHHVLTNSAFLQISPETDIKEARLIFSSKSKETK